MKRNVFFAIFLLAGWLFSACSMVATVSGGTVATVSNGTATTVSNPFIRLADVLPLACYGDSRTGTVRFVFTIYSKTNIIQSGGFGGASGSKFIARGRVYRPYSSVQQSVELVQGAPADCVISDIRDIPSTVSHFDRIELDWYFNPNHHSGKYKKMLTFYYVPIIWE
jgi:hypothetical protein